METLYEDSLVTMTQGAMVFRRYYFPTGGAKTVRLSDVERVEVLVPSVWNGKFRLQGSGGWRTWFPLDMGRPGRDRIFVAHLRSQRVRVGFTVTDGARMEQLLRERELIADP